jgi:putative mRNA 3-end processing factor
MAPPLLHWTKTGLRCARGGFAIDPLERVETAVITHAHSDHARRGSGRYFCAASGAGLLRERIGGQAPIIPVPYGERIRLGETEVSFHPAGHILGSAQIRVACGDDVWVASGDYKRDPDPSCEAFETVPCDVFITEATFGTPGFRWSKRADHGAAIHSWWKENGERGENSVLFGYSLGKSQRILALLAPFVREGDDPILIHDALLGPTKIYRAGGVPLAPTASLTELLAAGGTSQPRGRLVLAPPAIRRSELLQRLEPCRTAFASGWMRDTEAAQNGPGEYDRGFTLSDHADWDDLLRTARETGASRVFVQHRNGSLVRALRNVGIDAHGIEALAPEKFSLLPAFQLRFAGLFADPPCTI